MGVLQGIVKALDREHQYAMDERRTGIAERQLSDTEAQTKRANARQDLHEQLDASNQEVLDAQNGSRADLAVIGSVPDAPGGTVPNDPKLQQEWYAKRDAREAYLQSDSYKNAVANQEKANDQLKDVHGRRRAILGKLAGDYAGEVNNDTARTEYLLRSSGLDAVSHRQFANYLIGKHKIDPSGFIKDPQTGRSAYDDVAQQLYDGFQTGNWDGKEAAISALVPEQHLAVGGQLPNGNTVTRSQVSHAFIDPDDPEYVHISTVMQHEDGQGGRGAVQSPHMDPDGIRIPIKTLVDRAKNLFDGVNLMARPQAQNKLVTAMSQGDTALHEFLRVAGKAGAPPLSPVAVKRGETLIDPITHKTVAQGATYTGAQKQIFDELQDAYASGDPDRIEAAELAARSLHPSKYQVGGGGGGGGAAAAKPLKAGDMNFTIRAAQNKYMTSKGYRKQVGKWVDKDGNEPDDDAQNDLAAIESAVTDAGQDGKRLKVDEAIGAAGGGKQAQGQIDPQQQAEQIRAQYQAGKLTRDAAKAQLQALVQKHGHEQTVAATPPRQAAKQAAAVVAKPDANPEKAAAEQGKAIRALAPPVSYSDYVSTGPLSGAKRNLDADITSANESLQSLQGSMGDESLPESVRADMQHRYAAEVMRRNELLAIKDKTSK